jgi:hypothetical protein
MMHLTKTRELPHYSTIKLPIRRLQLIHTSRRQGKIDQQTRVVICDCMLKTSVMMLKYVQWIKFMRISSVHRLLNKLVVFME